MPEGLAYTVRRSRRARRIRLTVTPRDGLVVVVPHRWNGDPGEIVASKERWARRALDSVAEARALHLAGPDALLPDLIELPAVARAWRVEYRHTEGAGVRSRESGSTLVVSGAVDDGAACLAALNAWVHRVAREHLAARLGELSHVHGLGFSAVRVARQRSRWGSCSARGTISLNRNLMFLEPQLVDALLLHELAHTRVLDHSARFWTLLLELDPDAAEHRAALKGAGRLVPAWADA